MTDKQIFWRDLVVTPSDEEDSLPSTLGELVDEDASCLKYIDCLSDGAIVSWQGFFISDGEEEPDWDTPGAEVDWTGFEEAFRQREEEVT